MTEERITNTSTGGQKGSKLGRHDLIPGGPLTQLAEMYGHGAKKYAERNWERGYAWSLSYAAMQRHAIAFWGGEDVIPQTPEGEDDDPTAGVNHLVAVAWHAFAMLEWMSTHPELDDRPTTKHPTIDEVAEYVALDASETLAAWGRAGEPDTRTSVITEKLLQDTFDKLENPQHLPRCNHCDRLISTLGSHAKDCVVVAGIPIQGPPPGPERDEWKQRTFAEHYGGLDVYLSRFVPKGQAFLVSPETIDRVKAVLTPDFAPDSSIWDTEPWGEEDHLEWTVLDRVVAWVRAKLGR